MLKKNSFFPNAYVIVGIHPRLKPGKKACSIFTLIFFAAILFTATTSYSETPSGESAPKMSSADSGAADEEAALKAECMAETQKSKFVFKNSEYLNQAYVDTAARSWTCNAYVSKDESKCRIAVGPDGGNKERLDSMAEECKKNLNYFTYLSKAVLEPDKCIENATKFCSNAAFCTDKDKCTCKGIVNFVCGISKVDSTADCKGFADAAEKFLTPKERKDDVKSLCEDLVTGFKGDYKNVPQGNDSKYYNAVFMIGIFGGKNWPLFSDDIELDMLNINPEFIWYYYNTYLGKRSCDFQLESSWNTICVEYASEKVRNKKDKTGGDASPEKK